MTRLQILQELIIAEEALKTSTVSLTRDRLAVIIRALKKTEGHKINVG